MFWINLYYVITWFLSYSITWNNKKEEKEVQDFDTRYATRVIDEPKTQAWKINSKTCLDWKK